MTLKDDDNEKNHVQRGDAASDLVNDSVQDGADFGCCHLLIFGGHDCLSGRMLKYQCPSEAQQGHSRTPRPLSFPGSGEEGRNEKNSDTILSVRRTARRMTVPPCRVMALLLAVSRQEAVGSASTCNPCGRPAGRRSTFWKIGSVIGLFLGHFLPGLPEKFKHWLVPVHVVDTVLFHVLLDDGPLLELALSNGNWSWRPCTPFQSASAGFCPGSSTCPC